MSVRDIQSQLEEMYGIEVSPTLIANVTNAVLIACVDGLTVFPNAIQTGFSKNTVQLCIVHIVHCPHGATRLLLPLGNSASRFAPISRQFTPMPLNVRSIFAQLCPYYCKNKAL